MIGRPPSRGMRTMLGRASNLPSISIPRRTMTWTLRSPPPPPPTPAPPPPTHSPLAAAPRLTSATWRSRSKRLPLTMPPRSLQPAASRCTVVCYRILLLLPLGSARWLGSVATILVLCALSILECRPGAFPRGSARAHGPSASLLADSRHPGTALCTGPPPTVTAAVLSAPPRRHLPCQRESRSRPTRQRPPAVRLRMPPPGHLSAPRCSAAGTWFPGWPTSTPFTAR